MDRPPEPAGFVNYPRGQWMLGGADQVYGDSKSLIKLRTAFRGAYWILVAQVGGLFLTLSVVQTSGAPHPSWTLITGIYLLTSGIAGVIAHGYSKLIAEATGRTDGFALGLTVGAVAASYLVCGLAGTTILHEFCYAEFRKYGIKASWAFTPMRDVDRMIEGLEKHEA